MPLHSGRSPTFASGQVGLGYDLRLGANFSLTPYGNFLVSFGSDANFNGFSLGEDFDPNVFQFGLGLNWH